jgi:hypothetical protein
MIEGSSKDERNFREIYGEEAGKLVDILMKEFSRNGYSRSLRSGMSPG